MQAKTTEVIGTEGRNTIFWKRMPFGSVLAPVDQQCKLTEINGDDINSDKETT
jgi:hypothetical protein